MPFVTVRGRQFALLAALVALALGTRAGLAEEGTPASTDQMMAHHPAFVRQGTCAQPNSQPAFILTEVAMTMAEHSAGTAIPVEISTTTIDVKLSDLLAQAHEIDIHEVKELGATDTGPIACGNLGGEPTGNVLAVGIREVHGSCYSGIAVLQAMGNQTTITLYLAHNLSETVRGEATPRASTAQVSFHIATAGCGSCQDRVEASLHKVPGILNITFAGQNGQDMTVTYDPAQITPAQIKAALEA